MKLFGETAAQMCSAVSLILGWRPDEFWNCTPLELATSLARAELAPHTPDPTTIEALRKRFPDVSQTRPTNMKAEAPTMQAKAPR